jgi:hypothetical protein
MMRYLIVCCLLGVLGCGKERDKTPGAGAGSSPKAMAQGQPQSTTTYDEDPPVRSTARPRITPGLQREVDAYLNEPPLKMTAADLIKTYQDQAAGDKELKDRKVWLTGYVLRTGRGTLGAPYVELEPGKGQSGVVRCFFEKGRTLSVEDLKENQEVTVEGRVAAKTGSDVRFNDCRVLTPAEMQAIIEAARDQ